MRDQDSNHWHGRYSRANHNHNGLYQEVGRPTLSAGSAAVPTLLGSASAVVAVTLKLGMGSTDYQAVPVLTGAANLLGSLSITATSIVSGTAVNVTVQNTGLLSLTGATVLVVAISND